jgi:hypothetical protein
MSEIVYLTKAFYRGDFWVYLEFNTGEAGEIDLQDVIYNFKQADSLRDTAKFSEFYLDSWPTLAWKCGFDIAPESLYRRLLEAQPDKDMEGYGTGT